MLLLDAHRRLHEEEEPYKCKINNCNRCFSSVKSLRKHQAVWHNSKGTESQVEQQLREKLMFSEYPEYCIDEAVAYVKRYHYLDDSRYAEAYTRYSKEKFSRQMVKQKLMVKGVSTDIIDRVVENTYDADESEHIRRLLEKKHYDSKSCDEGEFRRIYQYLLRRGFYSYDILKEMKQYQELPC